MAASKTDTDPRLVEPAERLLAAILDGFNQAEPEIQTQVSAYVDQLIPALAGVDQERFAEEFAPRLETLLAEGEWSASDEALARHERLYEIAASLSKLGEIEEKLDTALQNDAGRIPQEGWSEEALGRAKKLGALAPSAAITAILNQLPAADWAAPAQAAAIVDTRAVLGRQLDPESAPIDLDEVRGAYGHQKLAGARAALRAWFDSDPEPKAVRSLIASGPVSLQLSPSLRDWAARRKAETRTAIAKEILGLNVQRGTTFGALTDAEVDQPALVAFAAKRIQRLKSVDDRVKVAETLAGKEFDDERARAGIARLIIALLKPGQPKGNVRVLDALLPALGKRPLDDSKTLNTSVRRAQKRHKLKFTEEQGRQLHALGVDLHKDWFGKKVAKHIGKLIGA